MSTQLSLSAFKASQNGRAVGSIITRPDTVADMESLSAQARPAVLAIDRALDADVRLDKAEKQHVGRWIRDVLGERGWRVADRLQFRGGRVFSSGAVYRRPAPPPSAPANSAGVVAARVARAQAMAREFSRNDYSVDDFIRDRRAEAARDA